MSSLRLPRWWLIVFVAILSATAHGQSRANDSERIIPRRALFAGEDHLAVALARDCSRVAIIRSVDGRRNVEIAAPDQPQQRDQVSLPSGFVPLNCQWSSDDRRLLVTCQSGGVTRVVAHNPTDDATVVLGEPIAGSVDIAGISVEHPDELLLAARGSGKALAYWRVPIGEGEPIKVVDATALERVHFNIDWEPRIAERALVGGSTELLRRDGQQWTPIHVMNEDMTNTRRQSRAGVIGVIGLDHDGQDLLLIDNTDRDRSALFALNVASGERRVVFENADADLTPLAIVDRRSARVLAVSSYFGTLRRHFLDPSIKADYEFLERHFGSSVGLVNISRDDAAWLVAPFDGGPVRFHVYTRAQQKVLPICSTVSAIEGRTLARRTAHVVETKDGLRLPCQLYVAPRWDGDGDGLPDQPLPTLLYVHGGPSVPAPWDSWFTNRNLQLLANRGYVVLNVDFRGAGGYGKAFVRHVWRQWGTATVSDVRDVAAWAVERGIAKADKLGIWGWSYGGLTTMSALAFSPDTFACGISMYGLSDLEAFARMVSAGPIGKQAYVGIGNPTTEEGRTTLRAQSPLFAAQNMRRPILLTHGTLDLVAPRFHSDRLAEELVKHGKQVAYLVYPGEGHDYRDAQSWISFWAIAERFLHDNLGGEFEPGDHDLAKVPFKVVTGSSLIPGLPSEDKEQQKRS